MAKDTFYFSHDYNARTDDKIKHLLRKFGMNGYGIYWAIIEDLYNNANELQTHYDSIAYDLRVEESMVKSIINDFDLFQIDNGFFGSLSVERRLNERNEKSKKARESALYRWRNNANAHKIDANALQPESDSNAINEIKEKERIENENKKNKILKQREEAVAYALIRKKQFYDSLIPFLNKYPKEMLKAFYDYWSEMNKSKTKMLFEFKPTFEISKRLATWHSKDSPNNGKSFKSESTQRKEDAQNLQDMAVEILQNAKIDLTKI